MGLHGLSGKMNIRISQKIVILIWMIIKMRFFILNFYSLFFCVFDNFYFAIFAEKNSEKNGAEKKREGTRAQRLHMGPQRYSAASAE